ncbi:MAG: biopolymer transporter ExbD, partial [Planctomycetaceae bacterium]|nr:biopolymer transporter ExbD [Planctomycetaceae bacterium]
LLLIFFMITASFSLQKGLDVPSSSEQDPDATAQLPGVGDFADRILVEINDQNEFSFKDASQPNAAGTPIPAEELFERINQVSQDEGKRKILILAHEKASHQAVVMTIDAAGRAGITDVSLADFQVPQSTGPATPGRIIRSN